MECRYMKKDADNPPIESESENTKKNLFILLYYARVFFYENRNMLDH